MLQHIALPKAEPPSARQLSCRASAIGGKYHYCPNRKHIKKGQAMIRHVASVAEIVEDVNKAVAFYRDTLGLEVREQHGDDYAVIGVPGVLHFGVWDRAHAAESTLGSRDHADRIPLGFTLEFEVENVQEAAGQIEHSGWEISQTPRQEPWGQKTCRLISPGGSLLGLAETPWARKITNQPEVAEGDA